MFFNVSHNEIGSGEVIHTGRTFWVIHRIREITDEGDVFSKFHHLPNAERTSEHAHV